MRRKVEIVESVLSKCDMKKTSARYPASGHGTASIVEGTKRALQNLRANQKSVLDAHAFSKNEYMTSDRCSQLRASFKSSILLFYRRGAAVGWLGNGALSRNGWLEHGRRRTTIPSLRSLEHPLANDDFRRISMKQRWTGSGWPEKATFF